MSMNRAILLLTLAGGGGHVQAANAIKDALQAKDANLYIIQRDLLQGCFGKRIGRLFTDFWNRAQKNGDISVQKLLIALKPTADYILWLIIFLYTSYLLIKYEVDMVIDTQPVGTSAILKAIRFTELFRKKKILLEKVITELPTDRVGYYFRPIKHLNPHDRKYIHVITSPPLLQHTQTEEEFWKQNCNATLEHIKYRPYPLRSAFKNYKMDSKNLSLKIETQSLQEQSYLHSMISLQKIFHQQKERSFLFNIREQDRVYTLMLGSQPCTSATVGYTQIFIEHLKKLRSDFSEVYHLFVFCNHFHEGKHSLFSKIKRLLLELDLPQFLHVYPLSFQNDHVIAPLFCRSDATLTRSGGLTSMELLTLAKGQIWIHSETKGTKTDLLKGMPIWEGGNALYLKEKKGARIVNPDTFGQELQTHLFVSH